MKSFNYTPYLFSKKVEKTALYRDNFFIVSGLSVAMRYLEFLQYLMSNCLLFLSQMKNFLETCVSCSNVKMTYSVVYVLLLSNTSLVTSQSVRPQLWTKTWVVINTINLCYFPCRSSICITYTNVIVHKLMQHCKFYWETLQCTWYEWYNPIEMQIKSSALNLLLICYRFPLVPT